MDRAWLEREYGLEARTSFFIRGIQGFQSGGFFYFMIPARERERKAIIERYRLTEIFRRIGERSVPQFVQNISGNYITRKGQEYFLLLRLEARDGPGTRTVEEIGADLAAFHAAGMPHAGRFRHLSRFGQWVPLWENRIRQVDRQVEEVVRKGATHPAEKLILDCHPYFSGLAENAMQYVADTMMDAPPGPLDGPTVCHERFTDATWQSELFWKNPFDWVIDHPARDIAEWIRNRFLEEGVSAVDASNRFLQGYRRVYPLSPHAFRLCLGRLLFPLHYLDCVEHFFLFSGEVGEEAEKRLRRYIGQIPEYERFLRRFAQENAAGSIPLPEWLTE